MKVELSSADISTIGIALAAWIIRCEREAASMLELAAGFEPANPDHESKGAHERCKANAAASLNFATEARELLTRLP